MAIFTVVIYYVGLVSAGVQPLCTAGVPSTRCWWKPQASTTPAGGHGPPAPSAGSQRQESQGKDPFGPKEDG